MNNYKPSIFTVLENQKSGRVFTSVGVSFLSAILTSLINVAIFSLSLNAFGFWYSVALFSIIRIVLFFIGEYSKYRMEQVIMKGGK